MRALPLVLIGLLAAGCASGGTATVAGPTQANAAKRHRTNKSLDLAINGDGYFIVKAPGGGYLFTRLGAFDISSSGEVANEDGYPLYPPVLVTDAKASVQVSEDGSVRVDAAGGPRLVGQIVLARFDKPEAVHRDRDYLMPIDPDSSPVTGKPGTKGLGTIVVGEVEE